MHNSHHREWLATAADIALAAGALLVEYRQNKNAIHSKGFRNIYTAADLAAESLILGRLREAFPNHAITSEEAGADVLAANVRWVVDPLDGTTNYSRQNPNFSTTLAAIEDGQVVVGVVYDPLRDHLFAARRGGGATLNGKPIYTSKITGIEDMVFSMEWPRSPALREQMWQLAGVLLRNGRTLRTPGSAAMGIAYVSTGWVDLYVALHLESWDQAAATLIVKEAGGCVETVSGAPWQPDSPDSLIAANQELITAFRKLNQEGQ
ncbi:MAG: inositol monophosphatase [Anaerolineae bacterium]|nr:inositol monophosphatase [Anaerolineae bacterium]